MLRRRTYAVHKASGKYQTILTKEGVFTSNDFGDTWVKKIPDVSINQYNDVKISSSGKEQIIVYYSSSLTIAFSTDYLETTAREIGGDLKYPLITQNGRISFYHLINEYYSYDNYAGTGYNKTSGLKNNGIYINPTDTSYDGKVFAFISYESESELFSLNISNDYLKTTRKVLDLPEGTGNYIGVKMSKTGKYIFVAASSKYFYVSSDYGYTWVSHLVENPPKMFKSICISDDGKYMLAEGRNNFYMSSDYGNSFESLNNSYCYDLKNSRDGKLVFAINTYGEFKKSSDYGRTFNTAFENPINDIISYDISSDGRYISVIRENDEGYMLQSKDYGSTWEKKYVGVNFTGLETIAMNR